LCREPFDCIANKETAVKTLLALTLMALLVCTAEGAWAEDGAPPVTKLFDDTPSEGSRAGALLDNLTRDCSYSPFARVGPRPSDVARCQSAEQKAIALGPSIVPFALARLNSANLNYGVRVRTYDLLARIGDPKALEPLVAALEKLDAAHQASHDRQLILSTLTRISYARVGERFGARVYETWGTNGGLPESADMTAAWRSWIDQHKGMTRAELLDERIADARQHAADADVDSAFAAGRFLSEREETRREGFAALRAMLTRPNLPEQIASLIRAIIGAPPPAPKTAPPPPNQRSQPQAKASLAS
jgi:hypothetical protein